MNLRKKATFISAVGCQSEKGDSTPSNPWPNLQHSLATRRNPLPVQKNTFLVFRDFVLEELPLSATVCASALGVFEIYLNGQRVGEDSGYDEMKPGHTDYRKRALCYTYDVTNKLQEGANRLLLVCGGGWYRGRIAFGTHEEEVPAVIALLSMQKDQNETVEIATDKEWQAVWDGPIVYSDIWDGELQDLSLPSYETLSLPSTQMANAVEAVEIEKNIPVTPHIGTPIRLRPELSPAVKHTVIWSGVKDNGTDFGEIATVCENPAFPFALRQGQAVYFDMGQNMVGREHIVICGKAGTHVSVIFGEMLNDSGEKARGNDGPKNSLYTDNYRSAKSRGEFVLSGDKNGDICTPLFTFYGFRYFQIEADAEIEILDAKALVLGNTNREVGELVTSNPEVNQLLSNIRWGQRGNYLSIPTDCPQRDERLGWTGDTQIFCRAAAYQADVLGFFHKWMQDVRDSQRDNGSVPDVIPQVRIFDNRDSSAAWGDACIVVPYNIYLMYGDLSLLEENIDMMRRYMGWLASREGYVGAEIRYKDWLAFDPTDDDYIARVYYGYNALLMAKMEKALGNAKESEEYMALYGNIREAFAKKHLGEDGLPIQKTQTALLTALYVGFISPDKKAQAVKELRDKIIQNGYRLSTGFVGTGWLCQALSACGEDGLAYSLLLQTDCPSWLYSVRQGATTIWERWNSYTLKDGFGDVSMNSFNHYAYGVVAEWMYRFMAGIEADIDAPGFRHIILQPRPDARTDAEMPKGQERIAHVRAKFDSPVGTIESGWKMDEDFLYILKLPQGADATLYLPLFGQAEYQINGETVPVDKIENGCAVVALREGSYIFVVKRA